MTPRRTRLLRIPYGLLPDPSRCPRPLTEPCLRYLRTRLLIRTFTSLRTDSPLSWCLCQYPRPRHPSATQGTPAEPSAPYRPSPLSAAMSSPRIRCSWAQLVSPCQRVFWCDALPSSGITHLLRYYGAIRLPGPHLPSSRSYRLSGILASLQEAPGSPGLPRLRRVQHAMLSDPGKAGSGSPVSRPPVLISAIATTSSFPNWWFRGSITSALRLTACRLAVLRLNVEVTRDAPRTRYPVGG